jgi:asparagine synthase (glutamine-hydrolysing)
MCGFVCLWNIDQQELAYRMINKIVHRGPDEVRVCQAPNAPVVMAHCRLSIIGIENGSQPLHNAGNVLVANGEIYNHAELRAVLGKDAFETESDSETILHLFRRGDVRWISKLDGMFAFVLATPERIVAARDPLGIKPLFVARSGDGLLFASELKAFDGLGLRQVEAIAPGAMLDSIDGVYEWYHIPQGAAELKPGERPESIWRELRAVLETVVRKWMVADVEVGALFTELFEHQLSFLVRLKPALNEGVALEVLSHIAALVQGFLDLRERKQSQHEIGHPRRLALRNGR